MKRNKNAKNIFVYIILLILFIFLSIIIYYVVSNNREKIVSSSEEDRIEPNDDIVYASAKPFLEEKHMKVIINNLEYDMELENNNASLDLLSVSPIELEMSDLNNDEKYSYLSFSLTSNDDYTGSISKGDVMLYQTNCLVIFYKDFDTTSKYTKIGHINNLPDFNNESIKVIINN